MGPIPTGLVARAVNRVTGDAPLARQRLARHAGKTVCVVTGPLPLSLTIQTTGEVLAAPDSAQPDLEVRVPLASLPLLAARHEPTLRSLAMEGDADLAQEIAQLAMHLRWNWEEDLSKVVGDAPAHAAGEAVRSAAAWGQDAGFRLATSAAEYWTEESPVIASRVKVEDFVAAVSALRDEVARLEKRIDRLAGPLPGAPGENVSGP